MNTPKSPAKVANSQPKPTQKQRKPRKLRIGEPEIAAMCKCLAMRMTERESCQTLGIAQATWGRWKSHARNSERLRSYLDKVLGQKIAIHFQNIEEAGLGQGPHKRADWRASRAALEVMDPTRYAGSQAPPAEAPRPPVSEKAIAIWSELCSFLIEPAAQVADAKEAAPKAAPTLLPEHAETEAGFVIREGPGMENYLPAPPAEVEPPPEKE